MPSANRPDLPLPWVRRIFQKLSLVYGRDFLSRWEGQELDDVMADWAHELAGFADQPEAIGYALQHLPPEKPPTVLQFRGMCNQRPEKAPLALPAPESKPAPELIERVNAVIGGGRRSVDPKEWAWTLRDLELKHGGELPNGTRMTGAQRQMWRTALADLQQTEEA
jgi:hypothetical protein